MMDKYIDELLDRINIKDDQIKEIYLLSMRYRSAVAGLTALCIVQFIIIIILLIWLIF